LNLCAKIKSGLVHNTLFASSSLQIANSISLSHKTSTSQPTVLFSHKKSAPATSTSQPNIVIMYSSI